MERRRRRQRPFKGGGARAPRISTRLLLADERVGYSNKEYQQAESGEIRPEGGDVVPTREGIRIVGDAARHTGKAEEVLREEDDVDTDEGRPKVQLADRLGVHVAGDLREPVVPAG